MDRNEEKKFLIIKIYPEWNVNNQQENLNVEGTVLLKSTQSGM